MTPLRALRATAFAALATVSSSANSSNCTIVLLGDSLIHKPFTEHNLSTVMASLITLPGGQKARSLVLIDSGNNGEEVASVSYEWFRGSRVAMGRACHPPLVDNLKPALTKRRLLHVSSQSWQHISQSE